MRTSFQRAFKIGGLSAVGIVIALVGSSALLCSATLHVPKDTAPPELPKPFRGETWSEIAIQSKDQLELRGWIAEPVERSHNCVLLLHGIKDTRAGSLRFAPMFLEKGYSVLLPDSRGHGSSGGDLVTYGLLEKHDAVAWAHVLRDRGCQNIYGLGESLGAAILIQASAVEPIFRAIAAECAYSDLESVGEYRSSQLVFVPTAAKFFVRSSTLYARLLYGLNLDHVSPKSSIAATQTPILLIHGMQDSKTPYWHSQVLARANPRAALWLVPEANHVGAYTTEPRQFEECVLSWFTSH